MGRHSAPGADDDDDRPDAPAARTTRHPRPGRHADVAEVDEPAADVRVKVGPKPGAAPDEPPREPKKPRPPQLDASLTLADVASAGDLDLIEDALYGGAEPDPAAEAGPIASDATVQIAPIVDPVLDEPVPEAITEQIPVIPPDPDALTKRTPKPKPKSTDADADADSEAVAPADPASVESSQPEPSQPEPSQPEPTQPEPSQPEPTQPEPSQPEPVQPAAAKAQSDLALLKTHRDVRARVAAGVVVPFVLYTVVLLAIGSIGWRVFFLWIWIPLISAGVVVGLLLDIGHRTYDARPDRQD